ncbi:MAG TPA: signal peptidase I [Candidatus Fimimorpha excrementavium]|nr:signal peptidase I [Candidatus Fimimorpha excrementavium]
MIVRGMRAILTLLEGLFLFSLILVSIPLLWGWKPFTVMSGSMEPELAVGSLVYIREAAAVEEGDVIAFEMADGNACIHRCIEVRDDGTYRTKGDANSFEDAVSVTEDQLIGREAGVLPCAGYWVEWLRTPAGMGGFALVFMGNLVLGQILSMDRPGRKMPGRPMLCIGKRNGKQKKSTEEETGWLKKKRFM